MRRSSTIESTRNCRATDGNPSTCRIMPQSKPLVRQGQQVTWMALPKRAQRCCTNWLRRHKPYATTSRADHASGSDLGGRRIRKEMFWAVRESCDWIAQCGGDWRTPTSCSKQIPARSCCMRTTTGAVLTGLSCEEQPGPWHGKRVGLRGKAFSPSGRSGTCSVPLASGIAK
jgi:hypothetical protein